MAQLSVPDPEAPPVGSSTRTNRKLDNACLDVIAMGRQHEQWKLPGTFHYQQVKRLRERYGFDLVFTTRSVPGTRTVELWAARIAPQPGELAE